MNALAWLANALIRSGNWLMSGQVVATGTRLVAPSVTRRARVEGAFGELGKISLQYLNLCEAK